MIDGKLTAEEANTFNLLKDSIFSLGILEYITIVRTRFSGFKNKEECDIDRNQICNGSEVINNIVKSLS